MKKKMRDLKARYRSLLCDCQYWRDQETGWRKWTSFPRLEAAFELWCRLAWWPLCCYFLDHDWESVADAENGSEDVWCNRCGYSHHAQF